MFGGQQLVASLAQLAEHALRKRMVAGSIPAGGLLLCANRVDCSRVACHGASTMHSDCHLSGLLEVFREDFH